MIDGQQHSVKNHYNDDWWWTIPRCHPWTGQCLCRPGFAGSHNQHNPHHQNHHHHHYHHHPHHQNHHHHNSMRLCQVYTVIVRVLCTPLAKTVLRLKMFNVDVFDDDDDDESPSVMVIVMHGDFDIWYPQCQKRDDLFRFLSDGTRINNWGDLFDVDVHRG